MKPVLLVCACAVCAGAATYYFSSVSGDDSRTAAEAQSPASPWASITRANTLALQPGDSVLFRAGEAFRGALEVRGSGTAGAPVVYATYGSGAKAVINGTEEIVSGWTPLGGGVYLGSTPLRVRQLLYNAEPMLNARYPNQGYLRVDSVIDGRRQFYGTGLPAGTDWTGASLHIRTQPWSLDARVIIAFDGGVFTLDRNTNYDINAGESYFINNHRDAVDSAAEWYWDSLTGSVWFATPEAATPRHSLIEATVYDVGILAQNRSHVIIDGFVVYAPFHYGIRTAGSSHHITIRNCHITGVYGTAISVSGGTGMRVENNQCDASNYYGIEFYGSGGEVRANTVRRIGLLHRLGRAGLGGGCCLARGMQIGGRNNTVAYNRLDSIGYNGIGFSGPYQRIERNAIRYFCLTTYDGAGIYTWSADYADTGAAFSEIRENIIIGGAGPGGVVVAPGWWSNGIYLDDRTRDITVEYNTVANTYHGIFFHNTRRHVARGNVVFDCTDHALLFVEDQNGNPGDMSGNVVVSNDVLMLNDRYYPLRVNSSYHTVDFFAVLDSNRYCNPYSPFSVIRSYRPGYPGEQSTTTQLMTLGEWQSVSGQDRYSRATAELWVPWAVADTFGGDMIVNGSFDAHVGSWTCWSERNQCAISWEPDEGLAGGALRATLATHDSVAYALVISNRFAVTQGRSYLLAFSARAAHPAVMRAIVRMSQPPYSVAGLSASFAADSGWQDYRFAFTAALSDTACRVDFDYKRGDSLWWLDNVSLYEVALDSVDNRQRVHLAHNQSEAAASVALPAGVWRDLAGERHEGSTPLGAYRSRVLVLDSAAGVLMPGSRSPQSMPALTLTVRAASGGAIVVDIAGASALQVSVALTTLAGRIVAAATEKVTGGKAATVWPGRHAPGTYVVSVRAGALQTTRRILVQ